MSRVTTITTTRCAKCSKEIRANYGIEIDDVRLLIRLRTEPVVRVMIEALDENFVNEFSQRIQASSSRKQLSKAQKARVG